MLLVEDVPAQAAACHNSSLSNKLNSGRRDRVDTEAS